MYNRTIQSWMITLVFIFSVLVCATNAPAAVLTQLSVSEALPSGVTGVSRNAGAVSSGIPLADSEGIRSVNQLGLFGASVGQFRPLAWWPSGNIKWVLVDTLADVSTGSTNTSYSLTTGFGNFGGSNLATDGSTIAVNTGAITATINKSGTNLIDSVICNSKGLVATGNSSRIEMVGSNNTIYSSENYAGKIVSVEENGPVKAVIKIVGSLKSSGGARLIDYTLRLYFYKGQTYVKGDVILRNASKTSSSAVSFKSAEIILPISIGSSKTAIFSRATDEVSSVMTTSAQMMQGYNEHRMVDLSYSGTSYPTHTTTCQTWSPPVPGTCSYIGGLWQFTPDASYIGLEAKVDGTNLTSFGSYSDYSQGYARLQDASNSGVTLGYRFIDFAWPAGFEFKNNGEAGIELYSSRNNTAMTIPFGKHISHEVMWDFGNGSNNQAGRQALLTSLNYPMVAFAPFEYYRDSQVLLGQKEWLTLSEQVQLFSSKGLSSLYSGTSNFDFNKVVRTWYWPAPGGVNQYDTPLHYLIDFLRTGYGGQYIRGEQWTRSNASQAVFRADDYTTEAVGGSTGVTSSDSGITLQFFDMEHAHASSIPLYYFISGNEEIRDSFVDYGNFLLRTQASGWFAIPDTSYFRGWSRKLRNMIYAYEFLLEIGVTPNPNFKTYIETALNSIMDSRENPSDLTWAGRGRNMDRGYLYWDTTILNSNAPIGYRKIHSFFHTQIFSEALFQTSRIMDQYYWGYSRKYDLNDMELGVSQFIYNEFIMAGSGTPYSYAFAYDYAIDDNTKSYSYGRYNASSSAIRYYLYTGQSVFDKSWDLLLGNVKSVGLLSILLEPQFQRDLWYQLNYQSVSTWRSLPLSVTVNGGGSYTLSWMVPTNVTKYQIKYSGKQIVEWLGFDKNSRTYQYDPAQYTAFFAANNITNNPTPSTPGTVQTITLTGLPDGLKFAIKYWSGEISTSSSNVFSPSWRPNLRTK